MPEHAGQAARRCSGHVPTFTPAASRRLGILATERRRTRTACGRAMYQADRHGREGQDDRRPRNQVLFRTLRRGPRRQKQRAAQDPGMPIIRMLMAVPVTPDRRGTHAAGGIEAIANPAAAPREQSKPRSRAAYVTARGERARQHHSLQRDIDDAGSLSRTFRQAPPGSAA